MNDEPCDWCNRNYMDGHDSFLKCMEPTCTHFVDPEQALFAEKAYLSKIAPKVKAHP